MIGSVRMFVCAMVATLAVSSSLNAAEKAKRVVVPTIKDITLQIQTSDPPNLKIAVIGEVPTGGYKDHVLTRVVYVTPPADGIQDIIFTSLKPSGPVTTVITPVKATDIWKNYMKEAPWLKGVRVHGIGEGVKETLLGTAKPKE